MDRPSSTSSSEPGAPWARGRWPWAALCALGLLALAEVGTRAWLGSARPGPAFWKELYPAYDGGFGGLPVCHRQADRYACQPTPYLNVVPTEFAVAKPPGEVRVFVVGASVSRGHATSYSTELEPRLAGLLPGRHVRVINLSANGIGSARQRLRLEEATRYQPDLFIVHPHGSNEYEDSRDRAYRDELHHGLGGVALRSRAVVIAKKWLDARFGLEGPRKAATDAPGQEAAANRDPAQAAAFEASLREHTQAMLEAARERGIPAVLVTRAERGGPSRDVERLNGVFRELAQGRAEVFELEAVTAQLPEAERRRLFRDAVHFTAAGHQRVAEALAPRAAALLRR